MACLLARRRRPLGAPRLRRRQVHRRRRRHGECTTLRAARRACSFERTAPPLHSSSTRWLLALGARAGAGAASVLVDAGAFAWRRACVCRRPRQRRASSRTCLWPPAPSPLEEPFCTACRCTACRRTALRAPLALDATASGGGPSSWALLVVESHSAGARQTVLQRRRLATRGKDRSACRCTRALHPSSLRCCSHPPKSPGHVLTREQSGAPALLPPYGWWLALKSYCSS